MSVGLLLCKSDLGSEHVSRQAKASGDPGRRMQVDDGASLVPRLSNGDSGNGDASLQ